MWPSYLDSPRKTAVSCAVANRLQVGSSAGVRGGSAGPSARCASCQRGLTNRKGRQHMGDRRHVVVPRRTLHPSFLAVPRARVWDDGSRSRLDDRGHHRPSTRRRRPRAAGYAGHDYQSRHDRRAVRRGRRAGRLSIHAARARHVPREFRHATGSPRSTSTTSSSARGTTMTINGTLKLGALAEKRDGVEQRAHDRPRSRHRRRELGQGQHGEPALGQEPAEPGRA